ncbi:MAG: helix-hairpin-helix domain-containing protein [Saprospiraceae bacterium]|nr:helix-hairpin-helix domain-containing protein [Saprospiraceae bacterium]
MKQNRYIEKHLYLPKGERNGIILFFLISVMCLVIFKKWSQVKNDILITESIRPNIKDTKTAIPENKNQKGKQKKYSNFVSSNKVYEKFHFNPNTIGKDSLYALGFSKKVIGNLTKYREKGGIFTSYSQLKRIYDIDTNLLSELKPYIRFTDKKVESEVIETIQPYNQDVKNPKIKSEDVSAIMIDINSADSIQLVSIKGIGPYYAKKIIKMRKIMGGFSQIDQLSECKILPDSVFQKIRFNIEADSSKMEKININVAGFRTLIQHPYFDENLVKVILNYRENHGNFTSLTQLKRIRVLTQEKYDKIMKHLKI